MVGREADLEHLHGWFQQAIGGARQIIFVTGESGIGKTMLVDRFLDQVATQAGCWLARGQCVEHYGAGEAYLLVLEAIEQLCCEPTHGRVVELLQQQAPTWLVQMPWLLRAAELEALQHRVQGASRERMLREMAVMLEALTAESPLVLMLEDLHCSDYATLDLIAWLARRGQFLLGNGIEEWPDGTAAGRYRCRHVLYQQVVYERLPVGQRMRLHRRVGERQEAGYGGRAHERAAELAGHFEQGRDYERAVRYRRRAAENALGRWAYYEAISHLTSGLELLNRLPDTPDRSQQELGYQTALGLAVMVTKGFAASEAVSPPRGVAVANSGADRRAAERCERIIEPRAGRSGNPLAPSSSRGLSPECQDSGTAGGHELESAVAASGRAP